MKERGQVDQQMENLMALEQIVTFAGKQTLRHSPCIENRTGDVKEAHERQVDERWMVKRVRTAISDDDCLWLLISSED